MDRRFEKCEICDEYHWTNAKCKPIFFFKHENWGGEFQEIRAFGLDDAAKNFAILYNEDGEYALMDNDIDVIVSDGEKEIKYNVSAEPDICYHVERIKEGEE